MTSSLHPLLSHNLSPPFGLQSLSLHLSLLKCALLANFCLISLKFVSHELCLLGLGKHCHFTNLFLLLYGLSHLEGLLYLSTLLGLLSCLAFSYIKGVCKLGVSLVNGCVLQATAISLETHV